MTKNKNKQNVEPLTLDETPEEEESETVRVVVTETMPIRREP